ncbi:MAG TPA: hypothetical protein VHA33_17570 [Candidatus Angelobacter sp.]|nr:hypothetical protein [Candidatus Angelobacter sp.]
MDRVKMAEHCFRKILARLFDIFAESRYRQITRGAVPDPILIPDFAKNFQFWQFWHLWQFWQSPTVDDIDIFDSVERQNACSVSDTSNGCAITHTIH